jgi:hypothetical protein
LHSTLSVLNIFLRFFIIKINTEVMMHNGPNNGLSPLPIWSNLRSSVVSHSGTWRTYKFYWTAALWGQLRSYMYFFLLKPNLISNIRVFRRKSRGSGLEIREYSSDDPAKAGANFADKRWLLSE